MGLFDALKFKVGIDTSPFEKGLDDLGPKINKTTQNLAKIGFAAVGTAAVGLATGLAKLGIAAVQTGAQFEGFQSQLTTLLGTQAEAVERLSQLREIASNTPFELAGLVEAETKLVAFGDSMGDLREGTLNLAAGLNLDVVEAASAVGRAFAGGAGAADILRERGVLAMVELRTGVKATELSLDEFRVALRDTLEEDFAGGVERASMTFQGMVSNLQDKWTEFQIQVADAGLFDGVKAGLRTTLDLIAESSNGVSSLAETISGVLVEALILGIKAVGGFVTMWDVVRLGVKEVEVGISAMKSVALLALVEMQEASIEWLRITRAAPQVIAAATGSLAQMKGALVGAAVETEVLMDDAAEIADNITRGADAALRFERSIRLAVEEGGALAEEFTEEAEPAISSVGEEIDVVAEKTEIAKEKAEEFTATWQHWAEVAGDSIGAVADLATIAGERRLEQGRSGAQALFALAKVAGIAEIGVNTAVGASRAFAALAPVLPLQIAAAGAVVAQGTAQAAAVGAQQFPVGGRVIVAGNPTGAGAAINHGSVGVQDGEGIVSRSGMAGLGDSGLAAINRRDGGGGRMQVVPVLGMQRATKDQIRRAGPVRDLINRNNLVGQMGF